MQFPDPEMDAKLNPKIIWIYEDFGILPLSASLTKKLSNFNDIT